MAYDRSVLDAIYRRAQQVSDPGKRDRYLRAAVQTGIVESGLRNLNYGDADSKGWRQERASLYKDPTNVRASVDRFFREAMQLDRGQPSWQLAADVQRPAAQFRGRYKDVAKQAEALLGGKVAPQAQTSAAPIAAAQAAETAYAPLPERPKVQASAPAAPAFAAGLALPQGYQAPAAQPVAPKLDVNSALGAMQTLQAPQAQTAQTAQTQAPAASGSGKFKIEGPDPDRLKPSLTSFAAKVADTFGGTLTGKDGSSHSKLTVNGNVSQHYTGNATDIFQINGKPATGARLMQAGRAALIAAGMPRAKALKAPGGLYNVGGHQIIFGVDGKQYGGNHLDHLHISSR